MNAPIQLRQLAQYPRQDAAISGTLVLMQMGEAGSPYGSILARDLVTSALAAGGNLNLAAANGQIAFVNDFGAGAVTLSVAQGELLVSTALRTSMLNATFVNAQSVSIGGFPAVTQPALDAVHADNVHSFNFRQGDVQLEEADILRAGGAPIANPNFSGWVTAPSHWDVRIDDNTVATAHWVHDVLRSGCFSVRSFNGRSGCVVLQTADVNAAYAVPGPPFPTSQTPPFGDASGRIATTLFVDEGLADLEANLKDDIAAILPGALVGYAPLDSPDFTGNPTAPTANPGTNTGQIATTAFVQAAVTASTTGVASFNGRTGAVTLDLADVTGAGGAPMASPALTGTPTAPTAAPGTNTTQLATTAFVEAALGSISSGVVSFNGRSGAVTLTTADVTGAGGAPINNAALTGTVTAPTPPPATNSTVVATTAYVTAALAAIGAGVTSFNSRTGAVTLQNNDVSAAGGALVASPTFTGIPAAPTAAPGTSTTQLATTAFVQAAISAGVAGVTSFNSRTGAVTLTTADVTGAGGAPIASPALTGVPTAPTAVPSSNDTTIATTAFVAAAVGVAAGVTSFNTRMGAVTLNAGDISAAGGAPIASPVFSGIPAAPTAAPGTNTTQLATTAFVAAALTAGAVISFNSRAGAVTLTAADITGAGGALLASPTFTGTPNAPTPTAGTNNTQIATTAFVAAAISSGGGIAGWTSSGGNNSTLNSTAVASTTIRMGASPNVALSFTNYNNGTAAEIVDVTNSSSSYNYPVLKNNTTGNPATITVGGLDANKSIQLLPVGTGTIQAPTAAPGTNSTAVATTAFVNTAIGGATVRSYLAGLTLSTAGSSATFTVASGVAADSTSARMMTLPAAMSKSYLAWAAGNGNGALDTGSAAALTWYHVHLIMRTDTGAVDVLVSLSATAPALPSPYTLFRRIGSMRTDGSPNWTAFNQLGDEFLWLASVGDVNVTNLGTGAVAFTLTVPTGVQVLAMGRANMTNATASVSVLVNSPDQNAETPGIPAGNASMSNPLANVLDRMSLTIRTSTLAQIRAIATAASTTFTWDTHGWIDRRGRDA